MPINMSWKCNVLVQRICIQHVQERPGIYTGFVKVNIEISKNVEKFSLKLQNVFNEILKFIKEYCCTFRRAVNAYEIGCDIDECLTRMQIASKLRNFGV